MSLCLTDAEFDNFNVLITKLLVLRKEKRIGPIYVEGFRVWISDSELDPYGTRRTYSIPMLLALIELHGSKKGVQSDVGRDQRSRSDQSVG